MRKGIITRAGWLLALPLLFGAGPVLAASNVLFILDASGSMAGKMGGEVKMNAAKAAFRSLLAGMPKDANVGLEVYGHRGNKDCSVIEVMNPVAPLDAAAITSNVEKLAPRHGATPMAAALERGAAALKDASGQKAIVLISDGKETCGGDPAAVAKKLRAQGIGIVTHVVGLGVNEEEKAQLAAIAAAGGGKYYAANNAEDLNRSLAAIKKKVITTRAVFRDDFNGNAPDAQWEVVNANPDSMIVEEGMLQIITELPEKKLFNARNMLLYKGDLPKEYEAEAHVVMTQAEWCTKWWKAPFVGLVLKQDDDNAIALVAGSVSSCASGDAVVFARVKNGKWEPGFDQGLGDPQQGRTVGLRIRRMQRKFIGSYSVDGGKTWKDLGSFTILRSHFRLGLIAARGDGGTHPMLNKVDWFELRDLKR